MSLCQHDNEDRNHVGLNIFGPAPKGPESSSHRLVKELAEANNNVKTSGFFTKDATLVLHHSKARQRHLTIVLDVDSAIGVCKKTTEIDGAVSWSVPCDLVGLNEAALCSKKHQKKRIVFVVHPETVRLASGDAALARQVEVCAKELIKQLVGKEWRFSGDSSELDSSHIGELKSLISRANGYIEYTPHSVSVCLLFGSSTVIDKSFLSSVALSLSLKVCNSSDSGSIGPKDSVGQKVYVRYAKNNVCETLLELQFSDERHAKWLSSERRDHHLRLDCLGFYLGLRRGEPDKGAVPILVCSHASAYALDENGTLNKLMLQNSQTQVEALRKRLEESVANFQEQQRLHNVREDKADDGWIRGPLNIIHQDEHETLVQITGSPLINFTYAISDSLPQMTSVTPQSKPLQVMVSVNNERDGYPTVDLASSPADSIDSGVSLFGSSVSSPSGSPNPSPVHTPKISFLNPEASGQQQQAFLRQRSTSESCGVVGLKGILKKTVPIVEHRGRFTRSLSECQPELSRKSPTNTDDSNCAEPAVVGTDPSMQKKRVSFSERLVQKHSFRPNSSILGQKKKNQRKSKNKMKKRLSEESSVDEDSEKGSNPDLSQEERTDTGDSDDEVQQPARVRGRILRSSTGEESLVVFEAADVDDIDEESVSVVDSKDQTAICV